MKYLPFVLNDTLCREILCDLEQVIYQNTQMTVDQYVDS